jgi:hypothetical protein
MAIFGKDKTAITNELVTRLAKDSSFSAFQKGSKLRAIIDALANELSEMYDIFDANTAASVLSGSSGPFTDLIADQVNVTRQKASTAKASTASETVKFYVAGGGTFGSINNGNDIVIPVGTIISTKEGGLKPINYFVTNAKTLTASATEGYVSVESQSAGPAATVGENALVVHNFRNYAGVGDKTLLVVNTKAITSAKKDESDNDLKLRTKNKTLSNEGGNLTAIRQAALRIPDVSSVYIEQYKYGLGSIDLFVQSISPSVSDLIIEYVQLEVDKVKSGGTVVNVRKPEEIGIALACTLQFGIDLTNTQKDAIRTAVKDNLKNFIDKRQLGAGFTRQDLINVILSTSPAISRIGVGSRDFDYINLYIPSYTGSTVNLVRPLTGDLRVKPTQKILVENSVTSPIIIR